jgi:hypothetical protein
LSTLIARKFICGKPMEVLVTQINSRGTSKESLLLDLALGDQTLCSLLVAVRIHRYILLKTSYYRTLIACHFELGEEHREGAK